MLQVITKAMKIIVTHMKMNEKNTKKLTHCKSVDVLVQMTVKLADDILL